MNEQFTKGPWEVQGPKVQKDFGGQTYFSIGSHSGKITKDTYECPGFFYPHSVQSPETMQANANLIGAAPEMYDALMATQWLILGIPMEAVSCEKYKNMKISDLKDMVKTALSKANPQ